MNIYLARSGLRLHVEKSCCKRVRTRSCSGLGAQWHSKPFAVRAEEADERGAKEQSRINRKKICIYPTCQRQRRGVVLTFDLSQFMPTVDEGDVIKEEGAGKPKCRDHATVT